jgi:hypothetical protein
MPTEIQRSVPTHHEIRQCHDQAASVVLDPLAATRKPHLHVRETSLDATECTSLISQQIW